MSLTQRARDKGRPTFFWQGLLILLPVAVMAVIGLAAILRDKAAVEHQAQQRAAEILGQATPELARRLAAGLATFDAAANAWSDEQRFRLEQPGRGEMLGSAQRPRPRPPTAQDFALELAKWQAAYPELKAEEVFPNRVRFDRQRQPAWAFSFEQPPRPPEWLLALSDEQRLAWDALRQAELQVAHRKPEELQAVLDAFLKLSPPAEARANAELFRLEYDLPGNTPSAPFEALCRFAAAHRGVAAESGVPLSSLALARALRHARAQAGNAGLGIILNALADEALFAPGFLLPGLLEQARSSIARLPQPREALDRAETLWSAQARLGEIARTVQQCNPLGETTNLWVDAAQRRWFCLLNAGDNNVTNENGALPQTNSLTELRVYPKAAVERAFAMAAREAGLTLPGYCGLVAQLAGEPLELLPKKGRHAEGTRMLAETHSRLGQAPVPPETPAFLPASQLPAESAGKDAGAPSMKNPEFETLLTRPQFTLQVLLVDPARLFAEQRQRTLLFGGLILASTVAALVGLAAARRAFYRQLRLSELKSNFVSSVSHELRAPIASVRLMAESLERGKVAEAPKQREYFQFIGQECRRLSALIENVLDFSRMEQGRKQYVFEPTDVAALAQQTVRLMETYAAERQVKLTLAMADTHLPALSTRPVADGKALQQALVNLIDNAMKHSPKGGVVTVGLDLQTESGTPGGKLDSRVILWVEDRGEGIPPEEHEKIFERFYRRGSELRRETQGVGIGLSIVKHIVEAHGGRVLVRSAVGHGSRFTIELPIHQENGTTDEHG